MKNKNILIVDDSDFDRTLLVKALARKGDFSSFEANCGDKCLEMIDSQKIDLILLDIMMPGTPGTQILQKIRQKFNAITLPVIMVTSKADTSDVVECLQNGANDYITKPVNFDVAISRITTHLRLLELSFEMAKLKEFAALDSMIATYNHEINNPLSIAIGFSTSSRIKEEESVKKVQDALYRIADIMQKIKSITDKKQIEYDNYAQNSKMIKL